MSTHLARKAYCSWCGRDEAGLRCPCRQVSYCRKECQLAAWSEHRLNCYKWTPSKSFAKGDIVKISGLQSEAGMRMNGSLAEVLERLENGRIRVILTVDTTKIKIASIKKENLSMILSALDAAKQGYRLDKEDEAGNGPEPLDIHRGYAAMVAQLPSFSGAEIVRRLRNGDNTLLLALAITQTPEITRQVVDAMLEHGLAAVCLEKFQFPESIDLVDTNDPGTRAMYFALLGNSLSQNHYCGAQEQVKVHALRLDICRRIGPALLVCASKKKRLFGRTKHWSGIHTYFVQVLGNCFVTKTDITKAFLRDMDPLIVNTLMEYLIFCLTVDPFLYLRTKSPVAREMQQPDSGIQVQDAHYAALQMGSVRVLSDFFNIEVVGESFVQRVAEIVVPGGAPGLTGRKFGECFLDLAAKLAVAQDVFNRSRIGMERPVVKELQMMHVALLISCSSDLVGDDTDDTFLRLNSTEAFLLWANSRMNEET